MATEVFTVQVRIKEALEVKGGINGATMILFDGECECDNFKGKILPGGVDTQRLGEDGLVKLSARYIMEGVDYTGKSCRIFIENNGEIQSDGQMVTSPCILTDSDALKYLEKEKLTGTVEGSPEGVIIHIFQ
ncbi:Protein of unknown function [Pseudobutyrivibrio sp. OR37]|uniref:DUF3237 family protein n=1 Tax=Pseudobutyrivibrio sp. OR37 TaxID=1798186 RepID=UPI0008E121D5|nr:DUF3237 family protein [Pseudobutyrivibrio sp. OR37]SFH64715.1 Protein of unknown function [Pseudobutyrivibrio sp. OR37]